MATVAGPDERLEPELKHEGGSHRTIFALSSGPLPAAIAVLRVSGPAAKPALLRLAGRVPRPRRAAMSRLVDVNGDLLDRALVLWMPGPASATGEDLVELHLHGSRATVAAVLKALSDIEGLYPAEPGEFTRQALVNGRMDLAQVEGYADLLAAETDGQRRVALRLSEGGLGRLILGWQSRLTGIAAELEAGIEFFEEHEDAPSGSSRTGLQALAADMSACLHRPPAERLRDGVRIVIAGPANAGKSTLLNALVGRDAAITSETEGTTRDLIEVPVVLDGTACLLIDSAGLRGTEDAVERIGIARSEEAIGRADLLLWLGSPEACPPSEGRLLVHAQVDRVDRAAIPDACDVAVSAHTGHGLAKLRQLLGERTRSLLPGTDQIALHARHRAVLATTLNFVASAASQDDDVLAAEDVREARSWLNRITGASGTEEMLDALFGRFCIGK